MNKPKLLFGINDFTAGGAQRLIVDLFTSKEFAQYELHLITFFELPHRNDFYAELPSYVSIHRLNLNGVKDLAGWKRLIVTLKKIKPDAVVSHLFFSNFMLRIMKLYFGYPIITVEHNTYTDKSFILKAVDKILSLITFKIVAVSKTVALYTQKQEKIPASKFRVIYNGINLEKLKKTQSTKSVSELKQELGFKESDKIIINVARLTHQKNHHLLIESFAQLKKSDSHKEYKLIILGDGDLKQELQEKVQALHLEEHIQLLGFKNPFLYYAISDFFISTSEIEGLSIAYIEALACGVPIVATKTAGTDEIIKDGYNGYIITKHDTMSVIAGIEKVIASNLTDMKHNAQLSSEKYSITTTAREYKELIEAQNNSK